MTSSSTRVSPEQQRRFREDGFFVLESALAADDLETLRGEFQRFIKERERELHYLGVDTIDLDHRGSRYFLHA
jgi:hypothetical protein